MKQSIFIAALFFNLASGYGQLISSNRIGFRYILKPSFITYLADKGIQLTDNNGAPLFIKARFKAYISYTAGTLNVDPWRFSKNLGPISSITVPPGLTPIDSLTPYPLHINLNTRTIVGHQTVVVKIPYRTWLLGFNTVGVKFRRKATDYLNQEYTSITANFNLGVSYGYSIGHTTFTHRSVNSYSTTCSFSLGFSSATLSKEPLKKALIINTNPTNLVLSPSLNITFARNDIGLTIAYGRDAMIGKQSSSWAYQGKGFFGFGLAAGLKL